MIKYDNIQACIVSKILNENETVALSNLDDLIDAKIKESFLYTSTMYIKESAFLTIFKNNNIPDKRRPIIVENLLNSVPKPDGT